MALGSTQPPIQWVPEALSLSSSAEVKELMELYLHSPIRLHGAVLDKHRDNFTFTFTYFLLCRATCPAHRNLLDPNSFITMVRFTVLGIK